MKKIIYLSVLALLVLNFACEKEEINLQEQENSSKTLSPSYDSYIVSCDFPDGTGYEFNYNNEFDANDALNHCKKNGGSGGIYIPNEIGVPE